MLVLNRDKYGETNIEKNCIRLMEDKSLIRSMADEDLAFPLNRLERRSLKPKTVYTVSDPRSLYCTLSL